MSNREQDHKMERVIHAYLERFLYLPIAKEYDITYESVDDKQKQKQGIDFYFYRTEDKRTVFDEKAASHYSGYNLSTFAFELSFINKGKELKGWFVNDELLTEYYSVAWPKSKTKIIETEDNIDSVDIMFISKKRIREKIYKDYSLDVERLFYINRSIREYSINHPEIKEKTFFRVSDNLGNSVVKINEGEKRNKKVYFCYSPKLDEKPINMIIKHDYLKSCADSEFLVSSESVRRINIK